MTISLEKQIEVAESFIRLHRNNTLSDWFLQCRGMDKDKNYLEVYDKLESGVFGECRNNAEYDEEGRPIKEATEFEVEISGHESRSGNSIVFDWDVVSEPDQL